MVRLRSRRSLLIGIPLVGLVVFLGGWLLIDAIQGEAPEELGFDDVTSTTGSGAALSDGIEGSWTIAEGSSTVGYRVKEVLFGQDAVAAGRTTEVTGTLEVAGSTITATDVEVDMASVSSDRSQRDGQFRGRIMSTDEFPTARFRLTAPIVVESIPAAGEEITATFTGDLTLRGVTRQVTADLVATLDGGQILVNGKLPIDFDEFEIPDASGGPATVGRTGDLEVLLVFSR